MDAPGFAVIFDSGCRTTIHIEVDMKDQSRTSAMRRGVRHFALAAAAIASIAGAHTAVSAQLQQQEPGAGTQFITCTNQAWTDYNKCLGNAGGFFSRSLCDLAWEADVIWCGAVLKRQLETGTR